MIAYVIREEALHTFEPYLPLYSAPSNVILSVPVISPNYGLYMLTCLGVEIEK